MKNIFYCQRVGIYLFLICTMLLSSCQPKLVVRYSNDSKGEQTIDNVRLKVYLENSGSMNGYMTNGSEFKDAAFDLITSIDKCGVVDTTELYFINSRLIPYNKSAEDFVKNMNPATFRSYGGNLANTDLADIINNVVTSANNNDVSLLISDFILDVPDGQVLELKSLMIRNAIKDRLKIQKDFSVYIMRLESFFDGRFNGTMIHDRRPYYMWLFGSKSVLSDILAKVTPQNIKHGVTHTAAFTPKDEVDRTFAGAKNSLIVRSKRGNKYSFPMYVNLKASLLSEDYICNPNNYKVISSSQINVESVSKNQSNDYSHLVTFSINKKFTPGTVSVELNAESMPSWVELVNQPMEKGVKQEIDKTVGILNLVQGVSDAFSEYKTNTSFDFIISKK